MVVGAESLFQTQVIGTLGVDFVKIERWQQKWNLDSDTSSVCFLNNVLFMEVSYFSAAVNREYIMYLHGSPCLTC